jgi:hypothetical protein
MTVNWRDIHATIQQQILSKKKSSDPSDEDSSSEDEESKMGAPTDPVKDPLDWLDNGLPDLSGFENRFFDLTTQFEIARYVDVLADSVADKQKTTEIEDTYRRSQKKVQKNGERVLWYRTMLNGKRGPDQQRFEVVVSSSGLIHAN